MFLKKINNTLHLFSNRKYRYTDGIETRIMVQHISLIVKFCSAKSKR